MVREDEVEVREIGEVEVGEDGGRTSGSKSELVSLRRRVRWIRPYFSGEKMAPYLFAQPRHLSWIGASFLRFSRIVVL
jgi:hypothetical protein